MAEIRSLPDDVSFSVNEGESLLEAGLRSGMAFAHACGGRAKCSTCRISVTSGLDRCPARTGPESAMAERLGFSEEVRLACQLRPVGDLAIRRLVVDETDMILCSQLDRAVASRSGEARKITVFFSDITGFTAMSEALSPYDVMYLLNRYFVQAGDIIERHGGFIDKFVGDGITAPSPKTVVWFAAGITASSTCRPEKSGIGRPVWMMTDNRPAGIFWATSRRTDASLQSIRQC